MTPGYYYFKRLHALGAFSNLEYIHIDFLAWFGTEKDFN